MTAFELVREFIDAELADRDARIAALEAQQTDMQKDMLTHGDIWREASLYRRNAVVTHDGTIFIAKEANSRERPGSQQCLARR